MTHLSYLNRESSSEKGEGLNRGLPALSSQGCGWVRLCRETEENAITAVR